MTATAQRPTNTQARRTDALPQHGHDATPERERAPRPTAKPGDSASVAIPLAKSDSRFPNGHIDVHLDGERAIKLRGMLLGLKSQHARLSSDRLVANNADVIRWIIDQCPDTE